VKDLLEKNYTKDGSFGEHYNRINIACRMYRIATTNFVTDRQTDIIMTIANVLHGRMID